MTDKAQGVRECWTDMIGIVSDDAEYAKEEALIHVIEHSAYQAAIERADRFEGLSLKRLTDITAERLRSDNYLLEAEQAFDRIMALKKELAAERLQSGKLLHALKCVWREGVCAGFLKEAVSDAIAAYEKGE
jgi:hypothetical protein